jgi:hypothetical protein
MAKYVVRWQEVIDYSVEVEAENEDDAVDVAWQRPTTREDIVQSATFDVETEEITNG